MRLGWIFSIVVHGAGLFAMLFVFNQTPHREPDLRVTEVSIIEAPIAPVESAPEPEPEIAEEAPEVGQIDVADIAAPTFDIDVGDPPAADVAPEDAVTDIIEDPSERDQEADLTAVRTRVLEPDVQVDVAEVEEAAPETALPAMAMPSMGAPSSPALNAPGSLAPRREAPQIASFTPPPPPTRREEPEAEEVAEEPETQEPEVEQAEPEPEPAEETEPETETAEDAEPEVETPTLRTASPRARPANFEEEVLARIRVAEEEAREAAAAREEEERRAALERQKEEEARRLAEALERAQGEAPTPGSDVSAPPPGQVTAIPDLPVGPPLTTGEKDALRLAVQRCWNPPVGLANAQDLQVVVAVELDPDGRIVSTPRLIEPVNVDTPAVRAAFEAGRRALLRCGGGGYDLPAEKYAQWRNLEVVFNPEGVVAQW